MDFELGHSEMIVLDLVNNTVEQLDNRAMCHAYLNSQRYNDDIIVGGRRKFDIDHGVHVNGTNIAIANLLQLAGYRHRKGHDMQARPYDGVKQGWIR